MPQGGKNRRRGKNDNDDKRELVFKEDGQGEPASGGRAGARVSLPYVRGERELPVSMIGRGGRRRVQTANA